MAQIDDILQHAVHCQSAGRLDDAARLCRVALSVAPDHAIALHTLGTILCGRGDGGGGLACIVKAATLDPVQPVYAVNMAVLLQAQGRRSEAVPAYRRALRLRPGDGRLLSGLGSILGDMGQNDEAVGPLRHAIALDPGSMDLHRKIAIVQQRRGQLRAARSAYRRTWRLSGGDGLLAREALTLPVIPRSLDEIAESRAHFHAVVLELLERGARIEAPLRDIGVTSFFLSYHGLDDRALNSDLARLCAAACPSLLYIAPHCRGDAGAEPVPASDGRLRIGFVSDYFHGHTIGMLNEGLIEHLSRDLFHVTLFLTPGPEDDVRRHLRAVADRAVDVPVDLDAARHAIAGETLDILYYPDIGMSPFTYFLAFARLAPVQCLTWGHPDTTGIPTLDHFLSCDAMEPEGAEAHYSENLVRLPGPTVHYRRPQLAQPRKDRTAFGLPADRTLYLCPQSLFKIHPDYDRVLIDILRRDPNGILAFVDPRGQGDALLARLHPQGPDVADRIRMLPGLGAMDFIALTAACDVMLDPFHYSGGKTTLDALAFGTPVVTWPGAFMRGRHTLGFYTLMNLYDGVARDPDDYVERAVRLGTEPALRALVRARILERCGVLYNDLASVRAIEGFLSAAVRDCRAVDAVPAHSETVA